MIGNVEDLVKIWDTLDTCYEKPEKYMIKALKHIIKFRKYRMVGSLAIRELYSLRRGTIKSAKKRIVDHLKLLINDQTIPNIMGKMPHTDWKQRDTSRPEWMHEEIKVAFERFVEQKWRDALNAAEPVNWEPARKKPEKLLT
jgi:hypothetical protein